MTVKSKLELIAKQTAQTAESLMEQTRDWQMIQRYLKNRMDEIQLSKKQKEKLDRYQYAYAQVCSGRYTDTEVTNMLMNSFGVKIRQAQDDMRCMREIYGTVVRIDKKFELAMLLQMNKQAMIKAQELDDLKEYAMLEKNRLSALALIEDDENQDALDFTGHDYELTFDPAIIGAAEVDVKKLMSIVNEGRDSKLQLNMEAFEIIPTEEEDEDEEK